MRHRLEETYEAIEVMATIANATAGITNSREVPHPNGHVGGHQ
jgi:hypothetical protein